MERWERQNGLLMILAAALICLLGVWMLWERTASDIRRPDGRNAVLVRVEKGETAHG